MKEQMFFDCCKLIEEIQLKVFSKCHFVEITRGDFVALMMFAEAEKNGEKLTITSISEKTNISKAAVSQRIKSAEGKGWVKREFDKNDERRAYVCLTPYGREVYTRQQNVLSQNVKELISGVDDDELKNLFSILQTVSGQIN